MLPNLCSVSSVLKTPWHDSMVVASAKKTHYTKGSPSCAAPKLLLLHLGPPFAWILLAAVPLVPSAPENKIYPGEGERSSGFDS